MPKKIGTVSLANEMAKANLNKPKTIHDVRILLTGHSGEKIRTARNDWTKRKFVLLINALVEQINDDVGNDYEIPKSWPPDETPLSPDAAEMLEVLKRIQEKIRP